MNWTDKYVMHENTRRKRKLQVLGNMESGHDQRDKEKVRKEYLRRTRKTKKFLQQKSYQRNQYMVSPLYKIVDNS